MNVLSVDKVSVSFRVSNYQNIGLKEYVIRRLQGTYQVKEIRAVRDVTFSLDRGEMLGIIGMNGAGKSTLLKAIAGILPTDGGNITVNGTMAAILELSSGFDGNMTVRENTYLRGALLGYTREFMNEAYDGILDFAELKEFEDYQFKQLSTGMQSRLGFAISALVKPDLLILDEVLSVGDGAFQAKSEKKMREIIDAGAATLFVSHSTDQVRAMCNRVLWLDHGVCVECGSDVVGICGRYEEFLRRGLSG